MVAEMEQDSWPYDANGIIANIADRVVGYDAGGNGTASDPSPCDKPTGLVPASEGGAG